jgi:hypothetical protein
MSKSINSSRAEEAKRRVDLIREVVNITTKLNPEITTDGRAMLSDRASKMSADALDAMVIELQERLQKKRKTEKERNLYCYRCGTSWTPGYVACTSCGSVDKGEGTARPTVHISGDTETFMGPWRLLPWQRPGTVGMFGGPGAGKSSLSAMIRPEIWLTKEQVPKPVGEMFRRLYGEDFMPQVYSVESAEDVESILKGHFKGPVVLDSATALKLRDGLRASEVIVEWCHRNNERGLIILQVNKDGQSAGYMEIPHLVDAVVNITPDPWGVRAFRVNKSRWGPLGATYWGFDKQGRVEVPDFPAAYSVEGSPGNYWLHPFPINGAKWSGLLAAMSADEKLKPRCASAAVRAAYMPSGFVEPMDLPERKRFAEEHGLKWIDPDSIEIESDFSRPPQEEGEE